MLPNKSRIKKSADFARVTKIGRRTTTKSLIGYLLKTDSPEAPKLGLIVGRSIGNSVTRHRIARQIRHAAKTQLNNFPNGTLLVVRVMKRSENAFHETTELMAAISKLVAGQSVTDATKAKI